LMMLLKDGDEVSVFGLDKQKAHGVVSQANKLSKICDYRAPISKI